MTLAATAPRGYRLTIATRRKGDLNRVNDEGTTTDLAAADVGAVSGTSNFPLRSGSLNLADPGVVTSGNPNANLPFDQSATATIDRCSFGQAVTHTLSFTSSGQAYRL